MLHIINTSTNAPIPPRLIARFTVEALYDYCQSLTQMLCQQSLLPEMEKTLRGLLCERVWMFAGDLKAPRWSASH